MRLKHIGCLLLIILLILTGCEDKTVAITYDEFSKRLEKSVPTAGLAYDYTLEATFSTDSVVRLSGSTKLVFAEQYNVQEASGSVAYSVPNSSGVGADSKVELDFYWTADELYSTCMNLHYQSSAAIQDVLPIMPEALFNVPQKAVSGQITATTSESPVCTVKMTPSELDQIDNLFGNTFQTITGSDVAYKVQSLTVIYSSANNFLAQMDIAAVLATSGSDNTASSGAVSASDISVKATITFPQMRQKVSADVPADLSIYTRNNYYNPLA